MTVTEHDSNCPRALFWDAGEFDAPCLCERRDAHSLAAKKALESGNLIKATAHVLEVNELRRIQDSGKR